MSYKINTEKKKKYGFKNLALASLCLIIFQQNTFSQGWIGNVNNIYPVNSSLQLTPLNVGIGTNLATAQLHTTGSVRFAGITANNTYNNILVQDANGNLFYQLVESSIEGIIVMYISICLTFSMSKLRLCGLTIGTVFYCQDELS